MIDIDKDFKDWEKQSYTCPECGNITANMKAPIILDIVNLEGEQIIIPIEKYTTDYIINKNA